jgi:hypothetical protein
MTGGRACFMLLPGSRARLGRLSGALSALAIDSTLM